MVLETDEGPRLAVEIRFDEHIADVPFGAGHAAHVEQAGPGQLLAIDRGIALPQQLVSAAHRQQGRAIFDSLPNSLALLKQKIRRDNLLFAILAAAKEDQVRFARVEVVADAELAD